MASLNNPFDRSNADRTERALVREQVDVLTKIGQLTTRTSVPPSSLNTFHRNPRQGDIPAIMRSLKAHTQYRPITVNIGTHTGRPHEVLAGNHTLMAIRELQAESKGDPAWDTVLVHWVDVDDDMCNRIVAVDNKTAQLGGFDMQELAGLLEDIGTVNLADIGYSDDDLADIRAQIEENALDLPPRPEGLQDVNVNPNTNDPARQDNYEQAGTRTMILAMPIPQFIWAQEKLAQLRQEWDVDNNGDVILALIADEVDSEVPDADSLDEAAVAASAEVAP